MRICFFQLLISLVVSTSFHGDSIIFNGKVSGGKEKFTTDSNTGSGKFPIRIPAGDYFICLHHYTYCLGTKTFPTYRQAIDQEPWFIEVNENQKSQLVYSAADGKSKFTLSYANDETTAFQLRCESCKSDFHGPVVSVVDGVWTFTDSTEPTEFQAFKFSLDGSTTFRLKPTTGEQRWVRKEGDYSYLTSGSRMTAARFHFIKANGAPDCVQYASTLASYQHFRAKY